MNDSEELLGKADALLQRLRPSADAEFPILTEVVELSALNGSAKGPNSTIQQVTLANEVDIEELCQRLRIQLTLLLEPAVKRWANEVLLTKLRQEIDLALQPSLERAVEKAKDEMLPLLENALEEAIESEINTRLRP